MRRIAQLLDFYRRLLLEDVIPFWLRHAIDPEGGINTCIRDDGSLVSRDKWLWSQWRAVWVFSKLYNRIEPRAEWLATARHIADFAQRGWDESARAWNLRIDNQGQVLDGPVSIYVDGFAIYGLTELARATGQQEHLDLAIRTADSVLSRLQAPHDQVPAWPYPTPPGARIHVLPMMFSLVLWELGTLLKNKRYLSAAYAMNDDIFTHFYRKDRDLLVERVSQDNTEYPPPAGTVVLPGHVIEDMWFQIHVAGGRNDRRRVATACQLIQRHLEFGWDNQYGGLFLALDADGRPDVDWKFADAKLWWPHTEALYAALLAYEITGERWAIEWHDKVLDYCLAHFPVAGHGEWTQKLTRQGQPFTEVVALPVKDPFHLPRALIYCIDVLERLATLE